MNTGLRDLKHCGTGDRAPMAAPLRATCGALIAITVLGTAYGLVADKPARKVVERTVTMTESEFAEVVAGHYRNGLRDGIAQKQCRPGDEFLYPPRKP